ncbi:PREDICTED: uncharacterized protein LOC105969583 [Erythranthe guttata]|uniref:uncharacterized protein LOC105969583 n=1 Tax=Erythranthe guttata TaxID=4155 RepID=UPI00064D91B5|nr:PREDICTED: uncharacterized protein LOC105969583 [Erythranthe guttata]|eukprot:XP_012849810.1 PREDICTED: uncharacterized protein LOC105969583 [Erythranthe guttata]
MKEMITEKTTDEDLRMYIDPDEGNEAIEVFVEIEPKYIDSAPPQMSVKAFDLNEPYFSQPQVNPDFLAATQGIPNYCETSGARELHRDPYTINYGNLGGFVGESSSPRQSIFEDDPIVEAYSADVGRGRYDKFYDSDRGILEVGMVFEDKKRLCAAVRDHSIRFAKREFPIVESKPKLWSVKCKHSTPERPCRWSLRGIEKSGKGFFLITRYGGPRNCIMDEISNEHKNLDRNYIACLLVQSVRDDPACKITQAQNIVRSQLGFQLSKMQSWYGLKRCRDNLFGSWESSVNKLPKLMKELHNKPGYGN